MIGNTYIFKIKNSSASAIFKYTLGGNLMDFKLDGGWDKANAEFLYKNFPFKEKKTENFASIEDLKFKNGAEVEIISPDISFTRFWAEYPYNALSKKKIAQERYEKLKEVEKLKLLASIPKYKHLKTNSGERYPYAEVFISQRWWDG